MNKHEINELLAKHGLRPEKRFGQNFLVDANVLNKIINSADLNSDDIVIEVGPGLGVLTRELATRAKRVVSIEIDKKLLSVLEKELCDFSNITLIQADVMKTDLKQIIEQTVDNASANVKIVANLPYNITTPFICDCLQQQLGISKIVVMIQKEAAERFLASPGTKAYGSATLTATCFAEPKLIAIVPPGCFHPAPDVTSAITLFDVLEEPRIPFRNRAFVFEIIRAAFSTRRKTLVNCLSRDTFTKPQIYAALEKLSIDTNIRGEMLTLEQFVELSIILKRDDS